MPIVREGAFEVLFNDTVAGSDPYNSCWLSFTTMRNYYSQMPSVLTLLDITQTFITFKRYSEYGCVFFEFYWACNLDQINVEMGKRLSNMSGFVDLLISSGFTYMNEMGNPTW